MPRIFASLSCFLVLAVASSAAASSPQFGPLPSDGKTKSPLEMRVLNYKGGTNGKMVIEVRNSTKKEEGFKAKGLYFVPDGDPEQAPQRLGAAGPFEAKQGNQWATMEDLKVKPGEVVQLQLDVFCINSHRASPNSSTKFSFASKRLPESLTKKIESGTKALMKEKKVLNALKAKGAVQGYIWKTRDAKWIKLQGERKNEKKAKSRALNRLQRNIAPVPQRSR